MALGPQPYPVVYNSTDGFQYVFESGPVAIAGANNAITALTGDVSATGPGSVAASITAATVTGKLLTGYVSGAGTVAASDTILQAFNKLNGNIALTLPLAGGTLTGGLTITSTAAAFIPPRMTTGQRDAIATPTKGSIIYNTSTDALNYYDGAWQAVAKV